MKYSRKAVKAALLCGSTLAATAAGFGAAAQPGTPVEPSVIQEVVVTAQRRSERLENVPASITAVTPQALDKAGVVDVHDLGRITPGAQINFAGTYTQPAIRGVTTLTNGPNVENNVAVYVDGFYDPNAAGINADFANLASIEVLKGPQGTLYGRNATGGAILVNTLAPSKTFTGKLATGYSRFNTATYDAYLSGPLSDRMRFGLAGHIRNSDGYIKKADPADTSRTKGDAAPLEQQSLRFKLEADVTKDLTATLGLNYVAVSDVRGLLYSTFSHIPASLPASVRAPRFGTAAYNGKIQGLQINREATLKLAYNTPIGTLTSYTGVAHRVGKLAFDQDGTYLNLSYNKATLPQDTFQQAVDYNITAIDKLDLVVGGLYYHDQIKYAFNAILNNSLFATQYFRQGSEALAFYVDGTYHFTDKLSVNLGGRYSYDEKVGRTATANAAGALIFPETKSGDIWRKFTPRATVRYEVAPRTNVYASYSKGFRAGQFNSAQAPSPALFHPTNPESIDAYEVGFKTARSRLRFDAAAFYYDYKDINVQMLVPNPLCAGQPVCNQVTLFANAPGAKVYGMDGQVTFTPVDRLNVRVGAAWLHGRYDKGFTNATGTGVNATNTLNLSGQVQDWSKKQMARAPNFTGNIGADYTIENVVGGSLALAGNFNYTSSYVINNLSLFASSQFTAAAHPDLANKQRFRQKAYSLLSAQATWTDPSEHYTVTVFGNNLLDKTYKMLSSGGSFGDYSIPGEPRSYGVRVGYQF